jgi:hypothetical protein
LEDGIENETKIEGKLLKIKKGKKNKKINVGKSVLKKLPHYVHMYIHKSRRDSISQY